MGTALLMDIGSTYTKAVVVDLETAQLVARAETSTTVEEDINIGVQKVLKELKAQGGGEGDYRLVCSSAAGGLKMVAIGLVPVLTAEAAKRAALGAGAKVAKTYSYEISGDELLDIIQYQPDLILLAGGTDGGNKDVILTNAKKLARSPVKAPIIVAGNKVVAAKVREILTRGNKQVHLTQNVMPQLERLNIEPVREVIRQVFLKNIIYAKGLSKVKESMGDVIMPTPSAVMGAAKLIADGTGKEEGLGEVLVVDIGGATTDIDSVAQGLPSKSGVNLRGLEEPYVKRTVEGDLGMRYGASSLVEAVGIKGLLNMAGEDVEEESFRDYIQQISDKVDHVPKDGERKLDDTLAKAATRLAVHRHVGRIKTVYGPMGQSHVQYGKDLTEVKYIIGTGGVVAHSEKPREILNLGTYDIKQPEVLAPTSPAFMVDSQYLLSSIGLLADLEPQVALKLAKKSLQIV